MEQRKQIRCQVRLERSDYKVLRSLGLMVEIGSYDISAALRFILRDWFALRMVSRAHEQFRSAHPGEPMLSLQEEIGRIKAQLRSCLPPEKNEN